MPRLFKPDGTVTDVKPMNGKKFTLAEAQRHVDGYVEIVHLKNKERLLVNEDGAMLGLDPNPHVTQLAMAIGTREDISHGLVGNVLWCSAKESIG